MRMVLPSAVRLRWVLGFLPIVIVLLIFVWSAFFPPTQVYPYPRIDSLIDSFIGCISLNLAIVLILFRQYIREEIYSRYTFEAAYRL